MDRDDIELVKALKDKIDSLETKIDDMNERQKNPPMTKEQIMNIKNREERFKAIEEHMDLFK